MQAGSMGLLPSVSIGEALTAAATRAALSASSSEANPVFTIPIHEDSKWGRSFICFMHL